MDLGILGDAVPYNTEASKTGLELMKQIATLASAVLVLSGTFAGTMLPVPPYVLILLGLSWLILVLALLCSIQSMSAIVQSQMDNSNEWHSGSARKWGTAAKWLFVSGVAVLMVFAATGSILKATTKHVQEVNVRMINPTAP